MVGSCCGGGDEEGCSGRGSGSGKGEGVLTGVGGNGLEGSGTLGFFERLRQLCLRFFEKGAYKSWYQIAQRFWKIWVFQNASLDHRLQNKVSNDSLWPNLH